MFTFTLSALAGALIGGSYVLIRTPRTGEENQQFVKDFIQTTQDNLQNVSDQALSVEQTKAVITKLIQYGSKDFRKEMGFSFAAEDFHSGGGTDWDKALVAPNYVMKNVELLQDVINQNRVAENNRKAPKLNVEFTFYAYDEKKRLRPSEEILGKAEFRRIVTPLKVFSDNGKLYVYVAWESGKKKENKSEEKNKKPWSFSTYRIDL